MAYKILEIGGTIHPDTEAQALKNFPKRVIPESKLHDPGYGGAVEMPSSGGYGSIDLDGDGKPDYERSPDGFDKAFAPPRSETDVPDWKAAKQYAEENGLTAILVKNDLGEKLGMSYPVIRYMDAQGNLVSPEGAPGIHTDPGVIFEDGYNEPFGNQGSETDIRSEHEVQEIMEAATAWLRFENQEWIKRPTLPEYPAEAMRELQRLSGLEETWNNNVNEVSEETTSVVMKSGTLSSIGPAIENLKAEGTDWLLSQGETPNTGLKFEP